MSACEKCWRDAYDPHGRCTDTDRYRELVASRTCAPEEQAGPDASTCPACGRRTLHQYTREPMCGCPDDARRTAWAGKG